MPDPLSTLVRLFSALDVHAERFDVVPGPVVTAWDLVCVPSLTGDAGRRTVEGIASTFRAREGFGKIRVSGLDEEGARWRFEIPGEWPIDAIAEINEGEAAPGFARLGIRATGAPLDVELAHERVLLFAGHDEAEVAGASRAFLSRLLAAWKPRELAVVAAGWPRWRELACVPHRVCPVIEGRLALLEAMDWVLAQIKKRRGPRILFAVKNLHDLLEYMDGDQDDGRRGRVAFRREFDARLTELDAGDRHGRLHVLHACDLDKRNFAEDVPHCVNYTCVMKVRHSTYSNAYLEEPGAERLLGHGDALMRPLIGAVERVHLRTMTQDDFAARMNAVPEDERPGYDEWLMAAIRKARQARG